LDAVHALDLVSNGGQNKLLPQVMLGSLTAQPLQKVIAAFQETSAKQLLAT
jgi:hypothetical protein